MRTDYVKSIEERDENLYGKRCDNCLIYNKWCRCTPAYELNSINKKQTHNQSLKLSDKDSQEVWTLKFTFQSDDHTLTKQEVNDMVNNIAEAYKQKYNISIKNK